ncbi:MAG: PAS domain-containing protein [Candidatus Velthaea sp.]
MNRIDEEELWRLVDVPFEKLDALPFGAIVVDLNGTIVAYNQYEARLARQERDAVLGKNFFADVAPCTAVRTFEGRLLTFASGKATVGERFNYFFPFAHGPVDVTITFLKLRGKDQILIAVERAEVLPPA